MTSGKTRASTSLSTPSQKWKKNFLTVSQVSLNEDWPTEQGTILNEFAKQEVR